MKTALITGINGFAGSHLAEFLLSKGYRVVGIDRNLERSQNVNHLKDRITTYECDIRDQARLTEMASQIQPDDIYHLAAIAHVPASFRDPRLTFEVNLFGSLSLFEAVRVVSHDTRILYVGSASEYGQVKEEEIPISEDIPLRPVDPYSVSKASADMLAFQYCRRFNIHIVRVRPFNHTGPRQTPDYVIPSFAKQMAEIESGSRDPVIMVGNLETQRDLTDVRDMVRGYWLALQEGKPGEVYNICSGKAISVREALETVLALSTKNVEVRQDPSRLRPSDVPLLLGDASKFRKKTGWKPQIPWDRTLQDVLNYWREKV